MPTYWHESCPVPMEWRSAQFAAAYSQSKREQFVHPGEFLAFMDYFRVFAWLSLVMIPVAIPVQDLR